MICRSSSRTICRISSSLDLYDLLVARSAEKAANEGSIFRRAVRKFIVDEGGRKHAAAFAARHQKSEARRKRAPHFFVVTERDGHRRAVLNPAQIAGQVLIRTQQQVRQRHVRESR